MTTHFIVKLLIVMVILAAAFFLYRFIFVSSTPAETPGLQAVSSPRFGEASGGGELTNRSAAADDEFIRLLDRLKGVKLNSDLFSTPAWKSFINFRVELVPEPKGRRNPFSPIGFDFLNPTGTTTATTTRRATTTSPRR